MAFDTYTNLQAAILAYLRRSTDTVAILRCPDWISLAEDEIRLGLTRLLVRQGETVNQAFSIASEYTALPTGFYRYRSLFLQGNPNTPMDYVPPQVAERWDVTSADKPQEFTIQGNQLRVFPPPNITYTATFTYFTLPSLSTANQTNWLLTAHPKLYYRAALAEAFDYYQNEEKRSAFEMDRERLLNAVYTSDGSDQQGSAMRARVDNGTP